MEVGGAAGGGSSGAVARAELDTSLDKVYVTKFFAPWCNSATNTVKIELSSKLEERFC